MKVCHHLRKWLDEREERREVMNDAQAQLLTTFHCKQEMTQTNRTYKRKDTLERDRRDRRGERERQKRQKGRDIEDRERECV